MTESVITHHVNDRTNHRANSTKFRGNVKIPRQSANSVARLEIPLPAENCGP